jgi:hypothetical protein
VEYQQIAACGCFPCPVRMLFFEGCPGTVGEMVAGLVFGTLLGPEATGPGSGHDPFWVVVVVPGFVCFWFPGCTDRTVVPCFAGCVRGVWFGVVV